MKRRAMLTLQSNVNRDPAHSGPLPPEACSGCSARPLQWAWEGSAIMGNLLCLLIGHKKTLLAFSRSRCYCRRCGIDLGMGG